MSPIPSPLHPARFIAAIALLLSCSVASAVDVSGAWARATIKGQTASVVYMTVTSTDSSRLIGASSPLAAVVQIHEMAMQGTTMKMRPVAAVDLPAGQPVELKPGGLHMMLMDLRQPLSSGDRLPLTLRIEGPDHRVVEQAVSIDVRNAAPMMKSR